MHKTFASARRPRRNNAKCNKFSSCSNLFRLFKNNIEKKVDGVFRLFSHAPSKWERAHRRHLIRFLNCKKLWKTDAMIGMQTALEIDSRSSIILLTIFIIHTQFRSDSLAFAVNDRPSQASFYFCFRWHFLMDSRICNLLRFFSKWTKTIFSAIELWSICPVTDEERQWWNNNYTKGWVRISMES